MPINRRQFSAADRLFFTQFDAWKLPASGAPNISQTGIKPGELKLKATRFKGAIANAGKHATKELDLTQDWDKLLWFTFSKIDCASYIYQFTGDKKMLERGRAGLTSMESCKRPHFTWSTCLGPLDIDLRTAHAAFSLAKMRTAFADILDDATRDRIDDMLINRILLPALHAERTKQYAWMRNKANWRVILCGMFAVGAMTVAEKLPQHRELIEYGIEGVLAGLSTGDEEGGWNEGPGYWDYGLSQAMIFAWCLRGFTGGKVDIFQNAYMKKTGDFRLYMQTTTKQLWNWSDCGKNAGTSTGLAILARVYQNQSYQNLLVRQGLTNINQIFFYDLDLSSKAPKESPSLTKHFPGCGVVVARTGFEDADTFVGFKAGDMPDFNHHCQMDSGQIVVHAAGKELLCENEHWSYPREASKDPKAPRPKRPGLYDEELKRWKRWDLDSVSAVGHNIPVIEGQFPKPVLHAPPRIKVVDSAEGHDVVSIDSSVYYKPMATKVRRLAVFLRPDVLIYADEIEAPKPVRVRLQFHYLDKAEIDRHDFRIINKPGLLLAHPLSPTEDDNIIIGSEDRTTFYEPPSGIVKVRNRFVYIENLWRQKRIVFVTALQFGKTSMKPIAFSIEGNPSKDASFTVNLAGPRKESVTFDVAKQSVKIR